MPAAPVHRFTFDTPGRALLFVRQVFTQCLDVVTFRNECVVLVIDGHRPRQTDLLVKIADKLGSVTPPPPPLPFDRPSRAPTLTEEIESIDIEWVDDSQKV